jgi:hypothetical protein
MVELSGTLSIGELATLVVLTGLLAVGWLRLRAAERLVRSATRDQRVFCERVEALLGVRGEADGTPSLGPGREELGYLREDSEVLDEGLVSRLAVAVSILVQHAELTKGSEGDPGVELLGAVREACLAVIETVWIKDLNNAYDASRHRREALFKRCGSVAELRKRLHQEDTLLREDMARLSGRLEEMLLASEGRYARASIQLTAALRRILK